MPKPPPADWQLPPGVNRGLWDYLHDPAIARGYDASLAGTPLFDIDRQFVEAHCPRPGRLIDLGCGTGRLLLAMAQRGWWTLGVDLSQEMLRVAGDKSMSSGITIHRLRANLAELDALADGSFDCAACLFSTLGMVLGATQRRRVIAHVFRLLRPGGRFILHVHNRWFNAWDRAGRAWLLRDWLGLRRCRARRPRHAGASGHRWTDAASLHAPRGVSPPHRRRLPPARSTADQPAAGRTAAVSSLVRLAARYGYLLAAERPA